jgi:hypothetical protein
MSCFESSKFLKNPQVMNQAVLIKACEELGWKYEIRQGELVVLDANQKDDLKGEFLLKVRGDTVTYNSYYMKNAKEFVSELQQHFFKLNVVYAKETILKEFEAVGFTLKRDFDFVANEEEVDRFYMVGYSKMENEDENKTEIQFTILKDGSVVTDSNYIPEDIHKLADEAMLKLDGAFGSKRREGIEIVRKEVPIKYQGKTQCTINGQLKSTIKIR